MNALRLCFGLLTIVPVGSLPRVDRRSARAAILLAPLAAVPLGALLVLAHLLVRHTDVPVLLVATLLVTLEAGFTRAMHLDGLADVVDGLAASPDPKRSLQVMKASDIGPFGVVALVLALLLQVVCLAHLLPSALGTLLAVAGWIASRHALAWACRSGVPAAQPNGLGALVAGTVPVAHAAALTAVLAALAGWGGALVGGWWEGPVVVVAALLAGLVVVRRCTRRLGGITGDVLCAVVEVTLTAGLVVAALLPIG